MKRLQDEDFGSSTLGRLRKWCWNLTEYPETSLLARVTLHHSFVSILGVDILQTYAFTSMGVVVLSTVVFVLSTMPELTDDIDIIPLPNTTDPDTGIVTQHPVERWEDVSSKSKKTAIFFIKVFYAGNFSSENS